MRALIIGGGIAGTTAALALHKAGVEPVVYEAYAQSAGLDQGVFLTIAVNGLDALAAIDAAGPVRELGFPTGKIRFANGRGRELGAMAIGPKLPDGTTTRTLRRAELYAALTELARERGIEIRNEARLTGASMANDGVVAEFADGTTATGDLLIGADGLRSTVRTLIDPGAPSPRYSGMGNVGGFTRHPGFAPDGGDYRMIWGKRCFFGYTVSPDGEAWWFANPPARRERSPEELRALTAERAKQELLELFAGDEGPMAELIASTTGEIPFGNQYDVPRVPVWHRDRMIVIGDAAHAVSPSTGQGVSLACEDAATLALCLRDAPAVRAAFARYEALRRERVEKIVKWGARMGGTKTAGPVMRVVRDLALPRILAAGAKPEAMERQAWMFAHHVEWGARATA
jgi:FAD-dependent urate hydroxylase